jgi:acetyl/propionyl-CoA carboxylase alpha subunit
VKVLVANRGEIACRILRTLRDLGIPSVAVFSEADSTAPHVDLADEAAALPTGYLDGAAIVAAAGAHGATALHPGYGFLSQNAAFAEACAAAGVVFIGPSPEAMRCLGDKRASRRAAEECGVPVIPGASVVENEAEAARAAETVGFPVLLKAAGGGGGKGMRRVDSRADLKDAVAAARREAEAAFADGRLLLERLIAPARHVEVQVLGDGQDAVALGERDCSLQRRYQKVIEEAPAPGISDATRKGLHEDAAKLARHAGYASAGTVEFLVDPDGRRYFLEVNTRLQVEHPVTEMLFGIDIVAAQIALTRGGRLPRVPEPRGHAIEARVNAEEPYRGFLPASGPILHLEMPQRPNVRVDSGIVQGMTIRPDFDPLLAKIIAWGEDREQARRRLVEALRETMILGLATNVAFLIQLLESDAFRRGEMHTTLIESTSWPEPPMPAAAAAAARRALERPARWSDTGAARGDDADRFSPWAAS